MTKRKGFVIILAFALVLSMVFAGCTARKPATQNYTGNNLGTPVTQADNLARAAQTVPGVTSAYAVVSGTTAYVGIDLDRNAKLGNTAGTGTGFNRAGTGPATTGNGYGPTNTGSGLYNNGGINGTGTPMTNGTGTTRTGYGTNGTYTGTGTTGKVTTGGNSGLIGIGNGRLGNTTDNIDKIKRQVASAVRAADTTISTVYVSTDPSFMNRVRTVGQNIRNGKTVTDFRNELNSLVRGLRPEIS